MSLPNFIEQWLKGKFLKLQYLSRIHASVARANSRIYYFSSFQIYCISKETWNLRNLIHPSHAMPYDLIFSSLSERKEAPEGAVLIHSESLTHSNSSFGNTYTLYHELYYRHISGLEYYSNGYSYWRCKLQERIWRGRSQVQPYATAYPTLPKSHRNRTILDQEHGLLAWWCHQNHPCHHRYFPQHCRRIHLTSTQDEELLQPLSLCSEYHRHHIPDGQHFWEL